MPQEQSQPHSTQPGILSTLPDLSHIPSGIIEHHMVEAFSGQLVFQLDPQTTISVDHLSEEFIRRQRASSEFNRP